MYPNANTLKWVFVNSISINKVSVPIHPTEVLMF